MAKQKAEKPKCKNCGDETTFSSTTGDRATKGWCADCYNYWKKHYVEKEGVVTWKEGRGAYSKTPYDGRPPKE